MGKGSGANLSVEVRNPSDTWGLVRADFEVVTTDKAGAVLDVQHEGLPGTLCCTIYQLPPGGSYLILPGFFKSLSNIAAVEVRPINGWHKWAEVASEVPEVKLTGVRFRTEDQFYGSITGRVEVAQAGPFNVILLSFIEGSNGFLGVQDTVDCIDIGRAYAFKVAVYGQRPKGAKLGRLLAFTSTIPYVGMDNPIGCD